MSRPCPESNAAASRVPYRAAFYALSLRKVVDLRFDVGEAGSYGTYHKLMEIRETALNREGDLLLRGLDLSMDEQHRELLRIRLSGDYCIYHTCACLVTDVREDTRQLKGCL